MRLFDSTTKGTENTTNKICPEEMREWLEDYYWVETSPVTLKKREEWSNNVSLPDEWFMLIFSIALQKNPSQK